MYSHTTPHTVRENTQIVPGSLPAHTWRAVADSTFVSWDEDPQKDREAQESRRPTPCNKRERQGSDETTTELLDQAHPPVQSDGAR